MSNRGWLLIFLDIWVNFYVIAYFYKDNRHGLLDNKYTFVRWGMYVFLLAFIIMYGVLDSTQFIYVSF